VTEIDRLLGVMSGQIFDREALLREVLSARVNDWLQKRYFFVIELENMRGIAHDILGISDVRRSDARWPDIERLHCMPFDSLSPVNLRESLMRALEFVGITEKTGADLLGEDGWAAVRRSVEKICERSPKAEETALALDSGGEGPTAWTQLALANIVVKLFDGDGRFDVRAADDLRNALDQVRKMLGIEASRPSRHSATRVTLDALHCKRYDEMDAGVRAGIKQAVWQVCGVSEVVGKIAFGEHWERVKALDVVTPDPSPPSQSSLRILLPIACLGLTALIFGAAVIISTRGLSPGEMMRRALEKPPGAGEFSEALPEGARPMATPLEAIQAKPSK